MKNKMAISRPAAWAALALAAALPMLSANARADNYPSEPIRLIVPTGPGGGMDLMARIVSTKMAMLLKTSIVIENKPGANGNIGASQVATSNHDGYTMLLGQTAQFVINPYLYSNLPYNPFKDFIPVVLISNAPNVVVVSEQSPFHTLADIVAAAKKANAAGRKLNFATPGNGTVSHLTGVLFQHSAGIQLAHIPYKGAAGAITDTIAGRVDLFLSSVPTSLGQIKGGKLRAIAVSAVNRSPSLPNVPTIGQSGYPGFDAGTWYGLFVAADTPKKIVQRLNIAANEALKSPDVIKIIRAEGGDVLGGTSAAFAALIKTDAAKWSVAVKDSGAKID
jgi:tripartite-type tricarboxylate transporter receptor subunit TctC